MSLRAPIAYLIPEQTVQIAQAAFPKGNPYIGSSRDTPQIRQQAHRTHQKAQKRDRE